MSFRKKQAGSDFTESMLPQNRKDIFWDVVKIHWRRLFMMGLLLMVLLLPLFFLQWIHDSQLLAVEQKTGYMTQQQLQEAYYQIATARNIRNAVGVLFWVFFGIGMAGVCRVIRQYAWMENVHFFSDFWKGVRDNAKSFAFLGFLVGAVIGICASTYNMLPYGPAYLGWVSLIQIGVLIVVILPVCALWLSMIPVYTNTAAKYMLLSFAVYLRSCTRTLPLLLCCLLICVPVLLPMPFFHIIGLLVVSFLLPFVLLAWTLYSYSLFDVHINPRFYPQLIGKGILGKYSDSQENME